MKNEELFNEYGGIAHKEVNYGVREILATARNWLTFWRTENQLSQGQLEAVVQVIVEGLRQSIQPPKPEKPEQPTCYKLEGRRPPIQSRFDASYADCNE